MREHITVKELPDSEKPYEKFLSCGAESLSDAELLAVIIRSGTMGLKSIEVAQCLLAVGGQNLLNIYELSYEEMLAVRGIGRVKAIQLKCVAELAKRIASTRYRHEMQLSSAATVANYYMERLRHEKQERVILGMFDSNCNLIADRLMTIGSATASFVSPREIFMEALRHQAVQVIILHNHPSGSPQPSDQDDAVTIRLAQCGHMIGIVLADHIIIGDHAYYSYREHGKMRDCFDRIWQ